MELSPRASFVDIFFLILCLRIIYMTLVKGYLSEIFKVTGLLTASLLAFHYYSLLGDNILSKLGFLNQQYVYFLAFLGIFIAGTLVFSLLRLIVLFLVKSEKVNQEQKTKWILFFSGAFRAAYLSSLIIFIVYLSPLNPHRLQRSLSYAAFRQIAPIIYLGSFKIAANSSDKEDKIINKEVEEYYEAKESLPGNSQKRDRS